MLNSSLPSAINSRPFKSQLRLAAPAMGRLIDFMNYNYRCVFPVALVATLLSLTLFCKLYRNYLRHGGDRAYQPPMPD